ncbi:DNA topoisomerase 1 [Sorochytrium milnesiophthora]
MFTGIVELIGTVAEVMPMDAASAGGEAAGGWTMVVTDCAPILTDCHEGDSIAINGTCLTVTEFTSTQFKVGLSPETLRKTNLGKLQVGSKVNLERAMSGATRFGGHFVQGHVDTTATISKITPDGNSIWFEMTLADRALMPFIVPKGFITVDGTSLTVCDVGDDRPFFSIMMISHTQRHVIMPSKKVGDTVNIEVDMIGKYVERVVTGMLKDGSVLEEGVTRMVERALQQKKINDGASSSALQERPPSVINIGTSDDDDDTFEPIRAPTSKPITAASSSRPSKAARLPSDSEDDDAPIVRRRPSSSNGSAVSARPKTEPDTVRKRPKSRDSSPVRKNGRDSSDDEPVGKRRKTSSAASGGKAVKKEAAAPKKKRAKDDDDFDDDDDDAPLSKSSKRKSSSNSSSSGTKAPKRSQSIKSEDSTPQKPKRGKASQAASQSPSKNGTDDNDEEGEGSFKWWQAENPLGDGTTKWTTLQHNGVLFPPLYEPHGVKMLYDGNPVELEPEVEEVATFFAAVIGTPHEQNAIFIKNFWDDFSALLKSAKKKYPMKEFSKCDFTPIADHLAQQREQRKAATKEEKQKQKEEKAAIEEKYGYALVDGRKEKVGNFRVEPPSLFRGRGAHPKAGKLKQRVRPEQITLNIGKTAPIPPPPAGHRWGGIQHDNTVTWLATWKENINNNTKYVFLSANSAWKGMSDMSKFEKARELKKHIEKIRRDYQAGLKDTSRMERQKAVAVYLIDRFALRAGNEKGEDEADTVGCCSLRVEHISLEENNTVVFDFLGKDSIRYYNEVQVDPQVHKNLRLFKKGKENGEALFESIDSSVLNRHLSSIMPGLTAKVFRTYNASITFQKELEKTPEDGSISEKVLAYNRANREVAILCNHQRSVGAGHHTSMEKIRDKIRAIKYQIRQVKRDWLKLDPAQKKKLPELLEPESDLDDGWIAEHLEREAEKEKEKNAKKLEKMNEKLREEGQKELKELPVKQVDRTATVEQCAKRYAQLCERLEAAKTQQIDKDENKTTALGTSKLNYIDPRITAAWCHKYTVPIEKMFTKTLRDKFQWAMDTQADWIF